MKIPKIINHRSLIYKESVMYCLLDLANAADNDIPAELEGIIAKCGITETQVKLGCGAA